MTRRRKGQDGTAFMDVLSNAKIVVFVLFVIVAAVNSLERIAATWRPDPEKGHSATAEAILTAKPTPDDLVVLQVGIDAPTDCSVSIETVMNDQSSVASCDAFRGRDDPRQWLIRKIGEGGVFTLIIHGVPDGRRVTATVGGTRGDKAIEIQVRELRRQYGGGLVLLTICDRQQSADRTGIIVGGLIGG